MYRRVGGLALFFVVTAGSAFGDYIVNGSFGNTGPAYWNNASVDGTGCFNIGCLVSGQYGTTQSLNLSGLSWATSSPGGQGDFYMMGTGVQYQATVLLDATANVIAFGIYDPFTHIRTALYQADGTSNVNSVQALVGSTFSHVGPYGFYIDVKYTCPTGCPTDLTASVYTYNSQNSTNTSSNTVNGGPKYVVFAQQQAQHFAIFQTTTPTSTGYIIGAEDSLFWNGLNPIEGQGDFQDFALKLQVAVPEPGSVGLMLAGCGALLALAARRKRS